MREQGLYIKRQKIEARSKEQSGPLEARHQKLAVVFLLLASYTLLGFLLLPALRLLLHCSCSYSMTVFQPRRFRSQ